MKQSVTPAAVGALVRDARIAAGLSQSQLGKRIGASRFWVAQFEKGKPSAELGRALKAVQAIGLTVRFQPPDPPGNHVRSATGRRQSTNAGGLPPVDLGRIIASTTLSTTAASPVLDGWPTVSGTGKRSRNP